MIRLLGCVLLLTCGETLWAQNPNAPKDNPSEQNSQVNDNGSDSRRVFFDALRETRSNGAGEISHLLRQESVRKEIRLSDEALKSLEEQRDNRRKVFDELFQQFRDEKKSLEQLKKEMRQQVESDDEETWKLLAGADRQRLIGLFVQERQASAITNSKVAELVGITEARRQEISEFRDKVAAQLFKEIEPEMRERLSAASRQKIWERTFRKISNSVDEMLSDEQKAKLKQLEGAPFVFEPWQGPTRGRSREGSQRSNSDSPKNEKCEVANK